MKKILLYKIEREHQHPNLFNYKSTNSILDYILDGTEYFENYTKEKIERATNELITYIGRTSYVRYTAIKIQLLII